MSQPILPFHLLTVMVTLVLQKATRCHHTILKAFIIIISTSAYFIKHNGVFEELPLAIPASQRIPYIFHAGKDQSLSGDIIMHLDFLGFPFNNDTLRFDAYIYDRALHKSNTVTTSEIILKTL